MEYSSRDKWCLFFTYEQFVKINSVVQFISNQILKLLTKLLNSYLKNKLIYECIIVECNILY